MTRRGTELALVESETRGEQHPEGLIAWALVELFGHARLVGKVNVDPVDFPGMIRVDVPDLLENGKVVREGFTRYFGRGAIYSVTPITEQAVRELLPHVDGKPARPVYLGRDEY